MTDRNPPTPERWIVHLLAPRRERAAIEGDLLERYRQIADARGRRQAGLWYASQVLRSIVPLVLLSASDVSIFRWLSGLGTGILLTSVFPALLTSLVPFEAFAQGPELTAWYLVIAVAAAAAAGYVGTAVARTSAPAAIVGMVACLYAPAVIQMLGAPSVPSSYWACLALAVGAATAGGVLSAVDRFSPAAQTPRR